MRRRLVRVLAVVAVCALACGAVSGADATPGPAHRSATQSLTTRTDSDAVANDKTGSVDYGIPPFTNPDTTYGAYGGTFDASAEVKKIRTTLTLPGVPLLTYLRVCAVLYIGGGQFLQTCCPDPMATSAADCGAATADQPHPHFSPVPRTSADDELYTFWYTVPSSPVWIGSPPGASSRFGRFPDITVSTLAFGSVPVSATAHLQQIVGRDGYIEPAQLTGLLNGAVPNHPWTVGPVAGFPGRGYSLPAPTGNSLFTEPYLVKGRLRLSLSDLKVDGQSLDLAPGCQTATPARLTLQSTGGQYNVDTPVDELRGRPGDLQVFRTGTDKGSSQGNIDIPAFAGCHSAGGEDFDALLTALVSGAHNPLELKLPTFGQCETTTCPRYPVASSGVAAAKAKSAADRSVRRRLPTIPAKALRNARKSLDSLSPSLRTAALAGMTGALRRSLTE